MQIDLRTVTIKPLRQTFDNIARRIGADKPASRYQEGTLDMQQTENFHYRPTWDPEHDIYLCLPHRDQDGRLVRLRDPRQFYYGAYTLARAKQQDTAEANFDFVENRGLAATLPESVRATGSAAAAAASPRGLGLEHEQRERLCLQLRHGLLAAAHLPGDGPARDRPVPHPRRPAARRRQCWTRPKRAWMDDDAWQGLRRYVEDTFVIKDPVELFVAQNVALDGLLYPLVYETIIDDVLSSPGTPVAMLTQFMTDWFLRRPGSGSTRR